EDAVRLGAGERRAEILDAVDAHAVHGANEPRADRFAGVVDIDDHEVAGVAVDLELVADVAAGPELLARGRLGDFEAVAGEQADVAGLDGGDAADLLPRAVDEVDVDVAVAVIDDLVGLEVNVVAEQILAPAFFLLGEVAAIHPVADLNEQQVAAPLNMAGGLPVSRVVLHGRGDAAEVAAFDPGGAIVSAQRPDVVAGGNQIHGEAEAAIHGEEIALDLHFECAAHVAAVHGPADFHLHARRQRIARRL